MKITHSFNAFDLLDWVIQHRKPNNSIRNLPPYWITLPTKNTMRRTCAQILKWQLLGQQLNSNSRNLSLWTPKLDFLYHVVLHVYVAIPLLSVLCFHNSWYIEFYSKRLPLTTLTLPLSTLILGSVPSSANSLISG